jgi:putative membrane protein
MLILVVLLVIAVAVLVALLLRPTRPAAPTATTSGTPPESEAERILRRRFASGEIDEEEFLRRRAALAGDAP